MNSALLRYSKIRGFTPAWQIKDLSAPALSLRRNGGWEWLRLDGFAHANPSATSTPAVGSLSQSQVWLRSSFAFTLAEVLITLAIIGVVAALTIPTVVRNYQKQQAVTQLKKAYSALVNTTNLAIANEGPISGWEVEHGRSVDFANKYLTPYLKVAKNCENKTTDDCAFNQVPLNQESGTTLSSSWARFYLTDSTLIAVQAYVAGSVVEGLLDKIANIYIDINGPKKPNKLGKDIFRFVYWIDYPGAPSLNGKFTAYGDNWTREAIMNASYGCQKDKTGELCAALIMKDSWQIRDDYPW